MNMQIYPALRKKAIEWINTKDRDFSVGLNILRESGYKPTVTLNISRWGEKKDQARTKLLEEIRGFIRMYANPDAPEHEDKIPLIVQAIEEPDDDIIAEIDEERYPPVIREALRQFYRLMQQRRKHHEETQKLQTNDSEAIRTRAELFEVIECISARMDDLWMAIDLFKKEGTLPADSILDEKKEIIKSVAEIQLPNDLEELKKLKKNEGVKLTRAKNMLLYCQETKLPKENPMPEGPKRVKYEKRVNDITKIIEQIDYKIVNLS